MQVALVHVCSGKTFPTCFIYWPTLEPMNELTPLETSSQSSLNKDSYSWFCFCGWLHLSFWSPLYQQAFTSALILQPQFVDRCRIKWFLLSVTDMFLSLWVVDGSDAASDEVAVCESSWCLTCCSKLFGIKGQLMTPTFSFQFPFVDLLTQHFSTAVHQLLIVLLLSCY